MSHFSVIVCTDDPKRLDEIMAPYDENREVAPYREYEKGSPSEYWLYTYLKRRAEEFAKGTGIKPYKPDELGWSSASSKDTPEVQRQEQQADAEVFRSLPDPITWADIATLQNERYGDEGEGPLLVDDMGRAYQMSTANPDAKWDYWRIGGRWGGYFPYKNGCARIVMRPASGWDSPDIKPRHCDGGPKSALDLDGLRAEKADEARKTYAEYHELVKGTPEAMPWSAFRDNISPENGYTADRAREEYHSQPRVVAIKGTDFQWYDDPVSEFGKPEKLYVEQERARAVPGYALVTLEGRWMAPGRMGWFGMSTDEPGDRIGYWEASNAYIDALEDSTYLVALDCHI